MPVFSTVLKVSCRHLDLVSLALESQIPLFLTDLDHARVPLLEGARQKPPVIPLPDIFALYRRVKTLLSMHQAFCPKFAPFAVYIPFGH